MEKTAKEEFVCVYRTKSQGTVTVIKSLLDSNKIPYIINNENAASLRGGVVDFEIMVKSGFSKDARQLLTKIIQPKRAIDTKSKISFGVIILGVTIIIYSGVVVVPALFVIIASIFNPGIQSNIVRIRGLADIGQFHRLLTISIIIFLPLFISGFAILRLKDWGRRLACIMFSASLVYSLAILIIHRTFSIEPYTLVSYLCYALIIYYLTRPKIKEQFK